MTLSVPDLLQISEDVAGEYDGAFRVLGVMLSDGNADHVEMLVTLAGCHSDDCRLMVNLARTSEETFEGELRTALRQAFAEHKQPPRA